MSAALWIYRHLSAYMWRARKKIYALINIKSSGGNYGTVENKFLSSCCFFQRELIEPAHKNKVFCFYSQKYVIEKFIEEFFFQWRQIFFSSEPYHV